MSSPQLPSSSSRDELSSSSFALFEGPHVSQSSLHGSRDIPATLEHPNSSTLPFLNSSESSSNHCLQHNYGAAQQLANRTVSKSRVQSPSPFPVYPHWHDALRRFLGRIAFHETSRGLDLDLLLLNPDWEHQAVPAAIQELVTGLTQSEPCLSEEPFSQQSLQERKGMHIEAAFGSDVQLPSTTIKDISVLLATNRAKNDSSNRREFLIPVAERRERVQPAGQVSMDDSPEVPSCSRADAKLVDRNSQLKYDIAKNEDAPLRKTIRLKGGEETSAAPDEEAATGERLSKLEAHLAIRYVPTSPTTSFGRLQCLEEHIIRLEREYPPWAALHFNQPNRGWPPPPRSTPVVVPPHLRVPETKASGSQANTKIKMEALPSVDGIASRNMGSSLQKAVAERLHVKQALSDMGS